MGFAESSFQKWIPAANLGSRYDIADISWGLVTLISDEKTDGCIQKLQLIWDCGHIISYHVTDETYRADCWNLDFEKDGRFYTGKKSEYIEMFRKKSPLFPDNAIHFLTFD